jgi:cytochrome b561
VGILFAAVLVLRLIWRATRGVQLPPVDTGVRHRLAQTVHIGLYVLLAAQVVFGFLWAQSPTLSFFGLFPIPSLIDFTREQQHVIGTLHAYTGWIIIIVAAGHAVAALLQHYAVGNRLIARMGW